jgi:hypothetical protein
MIWIPAFAGMTDLTILKRLCFLRAFAMSWLLYGRTPGKYKSDADGSQPPAVSDEKRPRSWQ